MAENETVWKKGRSCFIIIAFMLVMSIMIAPLNGRDILTVFFDLMKMLVGAFFGVRV